MTTLEFEPIHKLIRSTKKGANWGVQLCSPKNNSFSKSNLHWMDYTSMMWVRITCEKCIKLRYEIPKLRLHDQMDIASKGTHYDAK